MIPDAWIFLGEGFHSYCTLPLFLQVVGCSYLIVALNT